MSDEPNPLNEMAKAVYEQRRFTAEKIFAALLSGLDQDERDEVFIFFEKEMANLIESGVLGQQVLADPELVRFAAFLMGYRLGQDNEIPRRPSPTPN